MSFTLVPLGTTPTLDAYVTLAELDTYFAGNDRNRLISPYSWPRGPLY